MKISTSKFLITKGLFILGELCRTLYFHDFVFSVTSKEDLGKKFLKASDKQDINEMKRLLELGVDVDFPDEVNMNMPALSSAAYFGYKDVVEFLLNAGANRKLLHARNLC